ncbi:acetylglutamate kinase [Heyndrickxia sp. NPDC080065]|uniref:acetylglutamate kinase n=1 Tax=Heyndrickxia sp. NPDC080065 TaxID=3390568 RepID=UPI003CFF4193
MSYLVIKCGGSVIENISPSFFQNIVMLMNEHDLNPIIVHGGGPNISDLLNKLGIETSFINGMRVTTDKVLDVVEMVLSGSVNKSIVREIIAYGGKAIGLSGVDGMLLKAKPLASESQLGFVGEIISVNTELLTPLFQKKLIPVISPIAIDESGQRWNINGDMAAAAIAKELQAPLCLITNVSGVMKDGKVLHSIQVPDAETMIKDQTITGGMIPKVQAALECLQAGVKEITILNGLEENAILKLNSGEPIGTKFMEGIKC